MQKTIKPSSFKQFVTKLELALQTSLNKDAQKAMMPEGRLSAPNFEKPPKQSAVLILFFPDNESICFPIIRRPEYNGMHSGQMAFPGGKYEENDGDLIQTALRETCEEVGVCISEIKVLGTLSDHFIPITNMQIQPVVAYTSSKPNFKPNALEVDELFTIPVNEFLNHEIKQRETWNLRGNDVEVPYYLLQQQKVWGATAMILSELESILSNIN